MEDFRTVEKVSTGEYREKGSKFIAVLAPVHSQESFKGFLQNVKGNYTGASHYCSAYRLAEGEEYANDDGEPSHTAGTPILNRLKAHELLDVACTVIRYYGGTKLGKAGLIHAYKTSAEEACLAARFTRKVPSFQAMLTFSYEQTSTVEQHLSQWSAEVLTADYAEKVQMKIRLPKVYKAEFEALQELLS